MCGYMPPALVETEKDLIEYYVDGSSTVDPNAARGYSERFIHGELFKRFPEIQCVVHSHAEAVIPYATGSAVPLRPMYHMAGFMGKKVPVWDIAGLYDGQNDRKDMLVNSERKGAGLAAAFSEYESPSTTTKHEGPAQNVVLMKCHGYTTHGKDIATAVYRAVYTLINAGIQTNATLLQSSAMAASSAMGTNKTIGEVEGLSDKFTDDCRVMTELTQDKAWRLWKREVEASPVYRNSVKLT